MGLHSFPSTCLVDCESNRVSNKKEAQVKEWMDSSITNVFGRLELQIPRCR
jgi:hypothetical protein